MENRETALRYYELILCRQRLDDVTEIPLPAGYRFCFYRTDCDKDAWIRIGISAGEHLWYGDGLKAWDAYFGGHEKELPNRMLFVETESGEKVAIATAFYDASDAADIAWLHWVSVEKEHQGRGLSKPLLTRALRLMRDLGYKSAKVPTQTNTWLAVKIYLDLGFVPFEPNAQKSEYGYRIVRTLTDHPALSNFSALPREKLYNPVILDIALQLKNRVPDLEDYSVFWTDGSNTIQYRTGAEVVRLHYRVRPDYTAEIDFDHARRISSDPLGMKKSS